MNRRVTVKAWGLTVRDAQIAESNARSSVALCGRTEIVAVEKISGSPSPIPRRDEEAYAQEANFGWAWAAYEVSSDAD